MNGSVWLTIPETVRRLGVSRSSVQRLCDAGKLRKVKPLGPGRQRPTGITLASVEAYERSILRGAA